MTQDISIIGRLNPDTLATEYLHGELLLGDEIAWSWKPGRDTAWPFPSEAIAFQERLNHKFKSEDGHEYTPFSVVLGNTTQREERDRRDQSRLDTFKASLTRKPSPEEVFEETERRYH